MAKRAITVVFSLLAVISEGLTSVIQTQQTVVAAVGEDASLNCQLLETKDVLQVTWQKILSEKEKNLATNNKYFGQRVNKEFTGKVEFRNCALHNCSIVIKKVAETDESCYRCLFNTYPEGALTGRTCLQVYELHEPVLDVRESNSPAEWVVSCSATGRPAPTVTLSVSQQHLNFSQYNTVSVSNTNTTFTVTTTAVLSGSRRNSTQVGCAARVLSAPQIEVIQVIPEVKQADAAPDNEDEDGFFEKITSNNSEFNPTWIIALAVVAVVAVLLVLLVVTRDRIFPVISAQMKQQNKTGDLEKNRTPHKLNQSIHEVKTPLMNHENEQIRQRTSTKKTPKTIHSKLSPSAAKRLFEDEEPK
ncbi:OX-2 membrane glycoprotein-like [Archocentrus centrarchus]|uniref:OX-2 membrane glycoprotein-like n=1 Tax=Archocentrus centrarchus TaxID=63155 RepID=UPI0011EA4E7D|nr:OX-2 membrane glycoprotein-like [Archocentrus centrarchus]